MPRVAVIVPCYQSARYVRETLESVRAQTLDDWSLVVVDDGSTDDPRAAIADLLEADRRIAFVSKPNGGVASARNRGVAASEPADHYLFLDADDALEPRMLERMVSLLDERSSASAAYCAVAFMDQAGQPIPVTGWGARLRPSRRGVAVIPDAEPVTPFETIYCLAGIVPSVVLMRRSAYERTPGWDESFGQPFEDTLLFLHLTLRGELLYVPEPLVRHRRHGSQNTAGLAHMAAQEHKLYEWWRDPRGLDAADLEVVRRARRFRERRVVPRRALHAARRLAAEGQVMQAARHLAGGLRIGAVSLLRREPSPHDRRAAVRID